MPITKTIGGGHFATRPAVDVSPSTTGAPSGEEIILTFDGTITSAAPRVSISPSTSDNFLHIFFVSISGLTGGDYALNVECDYSSIKNILQGQSSASTVTAVSAASAGSIQNVDVESSFDVYVDCDTDTNSTITIRYLECKKNG